MKRVDLHFFNKMQEEKKKAKAKEENKVYVEEEEKKIEKSTTFFDRTKDQLFNIVDAADALTNDDNALDNQDETGRRPTDATNRMTSDIKLFRKRLMRWKNIGVWMVFISVGMTMTSIGVLRYYLRTDESVVIEDDAKHSWVILGLVFGGLNILCQIIACLIMMRATMTMKRMTNRQGFNKQQF